MSPLKRLTEREARTMTRGELLDRTKLEAEYWARRRPATAEGQAAEREFWRIRDTYLDPVRAREALARPVPEPEAEIDT